MYYTVYRITNLINGKIYVGVHRTNDLNDSYMGSGMLIKRAIIKYGIQNFQREYLAVFDNAEDIFLMEKELVNEDFVKDSATYNMATGGFGGCPIAGQKGGLNSNKRISSDPILKQRRYLRCKAHLSKMKDEGKCQGGPKFKGMKHSAKTKAKIGRSISKKCQGTANSQFGTMWITDRVSNKKISKNGNIPEGWMKGRVTKTWCSSEAEHPPDKRKVVIS